jgi:2-phospho-L-lactate guanylyltransferase
VLAIVPVQALADAKTRLAPALTSDERATLALEMLDCVLEACEQAEAVTETLVVTPDARVARGGRVMIDEGVGHGPAIAAALREPTAREGAVVVMADCPLLLADAIDRLVDAARPVALAAAGDGGMNGFAVRGPLAFEPAFGLPDAARATVERARAAGVDPVVLDDPLFAFDVDLPADLERLRALVAAA